MYCPRCGTENKDTYKACWNCFAQLHAVQNVKPGKPDKSKKKSEPEPIPEPTAPIAAETAVPAAAAVDALPVFDLPSEEKSEEPLDETPFIIPGLAEPVEETEPAVIPEPIMFEINEPAESPAASEVEAEPLPQFSAAEEPVVLDTVFDLDQSPQFIDPVEEPAFEIAANPFDLGASTETEDEQGVFIPGLGFMEDEEETDSDLKFGDSKTFDLGSFSDDTDSEGEDKDKQV